MTKEAMNVFQVIHFVDIKLPKPKNKKHVTNYDSIINETEQKITLNAE